MELSCSEISGVEFEYTGFLENLLRCLNVDHQDILKDLDDLKKQVETIEIQNVHEDPFEKATDDEVIDINNITLDYSPVTIPKTVIFNDQNYILYLIKYALKISPEPAIHLLTTLTTYLSLHPHNPYTLTCPNTTTYLLNTLSNLPATSPIYLPLCTFTFLILSKSTLLPAPDLLLTLLKIPNPTLLTTLLNVLKSDIFSISQDFKNSEETYALQ